MFRCLFGLVWFCDVFAAFGAAIRAGAKIVAAGEAEVVAEAMALATNAAEPEEREGDAEKENKPMWNGDGVVPKSFAVRRSTIRTLPCKYLKAKKC